MGIVGEVVGIVGEELGWWRLLVVVRGEITGSSVYCHQEDPGGTAVRT